MRGYAGEKTAVKRRSLNGEGVETMTAEEREEKIKELCKMVAERLSKERIAYPGNIKNALKSLVRDRPDFIAEMLNDTLAYEMAEAMRPEIMAEAKEMQEMYIQANRDLDVRESEITAREKACRPLNEMETAEARDRLRAYMLYRNDMQSFTRTPQNKSIYLAVAGSLLSGSDFKIQIGEPDDDSSGERNA